MIKKIVLFLLLISTVNALDFDIVAEKTWLAGKIYSFEIVLSEPSNNVSFEIIDMNNQTILSRKIPRKIKENIYSYEVIVPTNEKENMYFINVTVNDIKKIHPVTIKEISFLKKIWYMIQAFFGYNPLF